jgi:hypothetical protein
MNGIYNSTKEAAAASQEMKGSLRITNDTNDESCLDATVADEDDGQKNFAEKLFALLEIEEFQDIIHWLPSGEAFCITDQNAFVSKVMSVHFPGAKFQRCDYRIDLIQCLTNRNSILIFNNVLLSYYPQSFTRRMRRWGFHRIETHVQRTNGIMIFTCPRFKRGRLDLCEQMCDDRQIKTKSKEAMSGENLLSAQAKTLNFSAGGDPFNGRYQTQHLVRRHSSMPSIKSSLNPSMYMLAAPFAPVVGAFGFGQPVLGNNHLLTNPAAQLGTVANGSTLAPSPEKLNEIRAGIQRIDAELAIISRMKELNQRTKSLAAATNELKQSSLRLAVAKNGKPNNAS